MNLSDLDNTVGSYLPWGKGKKGWDGVGKGKKGWDGRGLGKGEEGG